MKQAEPVSHHAECPVESLLALLNGPWTLRILLVLHRHAPVRFVELKRSVEGISAKVLTTRLRLLESAGVIARDVEQSHHVSYRLAERGRDLMTGLTHLEGLALRWAEQDAQPREKPSSARARGA